MNETTKVHSFLASKIKQNERKSNTVFCKKAEELKRESSHTYRETLGIYNHSYRKEPNNIFRHPSATPLD
jgi:hypothetical protein